MLVHRLLGAALDLNPLPVRTPEELHKITNVCNLQKFNAKNASDESSNLFFLYYVRSIGGIDMRAAVLNVQANQLEVVLIETGNHVKISYKVSFVFFFVYLKGRASETYRIPKILCASFGVGHCGKNAD